MKIRFKTLLASCFIFVLCTLQTANAKIETKSTTTESYVVIGIKPEYMVALQYGKVENERFYPRTFVTEHFLIKAPKKGYLVAKIKGGKPGEVIGIVSIFTASNLFKFGKSYVPCSNAVTFAIPHAQVVYVGDVTFIPKNGIIDVETSHDFNAAKAFLDENHTELKGRLIEGSLSMLKMEDASCIVPR